MSTYKIVSRDGVVIASVRARSLVEAIATEAASHAPADAEIIRANRATLLARHELWPGNSLGWSLVPVERPKQIR